MTLLEYITQERGRQAALVKAIGAHASDVSAWAHGNRPIPVPYGAPIEQATGGAVTRKEMFPGNWQIIWPELAEPTAIPGTPIDGRKVREAKNGVRQIPFNVKPLRE